MHACMHAVLERSLFKSSRARNLSHGCLDHEQELAQSDQLL
jgi:hypothetical protein